MQILSKNQLDKLILELGTENPPNPDFNFLDQCLFYAGFLGEREDDILRLEQNISRQTILYSRYYWLASYIQGFKERFSHQEGLEELQLLKLAQEINAKLGLETDWELLLELKNHPDQIDLEDQGRL